MMTKTTLERCALAYCRHMREVDELEPRLPMCELACEWCTAKAEAIINELMEPTEAVMSAGLEGYAKADVAGREAAIESAWQAMIQAIKSGK